MQYYNRVDGVWYKVDPLEIKKNKNLFTKPREDKFEETVRQNILKALDMLTKNPSTYGKTFYTYLPLPWETVDWQSFNKRYGKDDFRPGNYEHVGEKASCLSESSKQFSGQTGDMYELFLEWAQHIVNNKGASSAWKTFRIEDSYPYYRLFLLNKGTQLYGRVGGDFSFNASDIQLNFKPDDILYSTVPFVVSYTPRNTSLKQSN